MHFAPLRQSLLIVTMIAALIVPASADLLDLPHRGGPIPLTTNGVPHVQIGVEAIPEISTELLRQVSNIPGVEFGETVLSLPGAKGFWVRKNIQLANPDAIIRGREFAHLHPDGSLHASLSPKLAKEAVATGWATHHPWANQRPGWKGFVMIYTPGSKEELEVVFRLVVESYNFVTGQDYSIVDGSPAPLIYALLAVRGRTYQYQIR